MAKQTKSNVAPAPAGAPQTAGTTATAGPVIERGANDIFIAVPIMDGDSQKLDANKQPMFVEPPKKLAPQAMTIINTIRAAGEKGLTRSQLNANLKGVLVTRQPESRIVTYYQKPILLSGCVTMVKAVEAPAAVVQAPAPAAA